MDALKIISEGSIKAEKPQFNVGDTVRVDVRIKEGDRERIQAFEGTVIAKKHGGVAETFTVRRVAYGVGCILSTHVRMWRMLIRHRRTRVSESKQTTICENRGRRSLSLPDLYSAL